MAVHPHEPARVLVLQGGGALGAYQGGVYESLSAEIEARPKAGGAKTFDIHRGTQKA